MILGMAKKRFQTFETLPHVTKIIIKHKPKNIQGKNIPKKNQFRTSGVGNISPSGLPKEAVFQTK
jgi:hypothetical protein